MPISFLPVRPPADDSDELPAMSLMDHLEELRRRIMRSLIGFCVSFALCWAFHREIFAFLKAPI